MDTIQWLEKLISFDTTSSNSNLELIEAIADWFKQHHIEFELIHDNQHPSLKANLFATIPAKNNHLQGGILLSGHTDVVPVVGQMWETNPFLATRHDGKIYGRGACDMKGFLAVMLALVPEMKTLNLVKPIHFSFTFDEEVGCIGVDYLIDFMLKKRIQPEGCIVGEPSSMKPITGEKSRQVYHCQVQGLAVHSSLANQGCNAIEYASRLICHISQLAKEQEKYGPFDTQFDCPFTTITTNIVSGGTAYNITPGLCEFIVEIRFLPQFSVKNIIDKIEGFINNELLPEMQKKYSEAAIFLDQISDATGFQAEEDCQFVQIIRSITGIKTQSKVSYSTEASAFQHANIPTIVCGPGDINQAHRPNEYIDIDQLVLCENILRKVIKHFCVNG